MDHQRNRKIGKAGEKAALDFLMKKGYQFIDNNYYSSFGEIDLIVMDDDTIVFVEVKTRASSVETALRSMTTSKCNKIMKTAQIFLMKHPEYEEMFTRFDLISVIVGPDKTEIHHLIEAINF